MVTRCRDVWCAAYGWVPVLVLAAECRSGPSRRVRARGRTAATLLIFLVLPFWATRGPRGSTLADAVHPSGHSGVAKDTRHTRGRPAAPPGSALRIAVVVRLDEGDVVGFCLGCDSGVDQLLPCLLGDPERSLLSGRELVCVDVTGDGLGEGDPGRLVTDLEHVPPRAGRIARHHMQVLPGTVRLFVVHRDAPDQPANSAPSVVTTGKRARRPRATRTTARRPSACGRPEPGSAVCRNRRLHGVTGSKVG